MDNRALPPKTSNFYCLPGRAGGTPMGISGKRKARRSATTMASESGTAAMRSRPINARHWVDHAAAKSSVKPVDVSVGKPVPRRSNVRLTAFARIE
jgi:hypothetical protein